MYTNMRKLYPIKIAFNEQQLKAAQQTLEFKNPQN